MKAIVFHGVGDIRLENVSDPKIQEPTDAVVRLTASAICGTDLHFVRGTVPGMVPGTILGHEGVGIVEEVGADVRSFQPGDRVVMTATIACGSCSYCRAGYQSQCDRANPNGPQAGTSFFGGPKETGPFQGLQAERARIPFANVGMVRLPDEVSDDQAILLSDIAPTGYFGADLAEITPGDTVAVFGCGPVGLFAIVSARLLGAGRIFAVDTIESRLEMARAQGAEIVDFNAEHPVEALRRLTGGIGVDRAIDAVGVDASQPSGGPAAPSHDERKMFQQEIEQIEAQGRELPKEWNPGNAPSQVFTWGVQGLAKAGTFSVIGVYPPTFSSFPMGMAMNRNLTIKAGNCNHRRYLPRLVDWTRNRTIDPLRILTQRQPITSALEAYKTFAQHRPGWVKVELEPSMR
ncbi:MAG TPA: zinc-dependent alcohol dehydrogenase [Isosphaeraceae bacterium]|nr:zinc-dependent alcohol dehydrogenase [Isosphaeraceae bacterium]